MKIPLPDKFEPVADSIMKKVVGFEGWVEDNYSKYHRTDHSDYMKEQIELSVVNEPECNKQAARARIRHLLKHAKKGNWAFEELETRWGFVGDFSPHDWGPEKEYNH